jgi:DNA-directed RNA polymerase specialized sigma24 family protein
VNGYFVDNPQAPAHHEEYLDPFSDGSPVSPNSHSITRWLDALRTGDAVAGRAVWERFLERMLAVARRRLAGASRRVSDEEDAVVVAFERFLHGVRQDRFPRLRDRDDLWAILFTLTERAAANQQRDQNRDKRGGGDVRGDSALEGIEAVAAGPTPADEVSMQENMARLIAGLEDEELRQIALARMEGYPNAEIAGQIGRAEVTVERRLRLIRATWRAMGEGVSDFS